MNETQILGTWIKNYDWTWENCGHFQLVSVTLNLFFVAGSFKVRIYDLVKMSKLEKLEDDSEKSETDDMLQV